MMGQSRDVSRTRGDLRGDQSSSGDTPPEKKPARWLNEISTSGKKGSHEATGHTDSTDLGRGRMQELEPLQKDRSGSSDSTSPQRKVSPFLASGKGVLDKLWKGTKPETLEKKKEYHQTLFEELKRNNIELDRVNATREKYINVMNVEHDEGSALSEKAFELMGEMSLLGKQLEKGPLKKEVEAWYQQQEAAEHTEDPIHHESSDVQATEKEDTDKMDIGYHQGLFNEVKQDYEKLDRINENRRIDMNKRGVDQDYDSPLFQESYDIKDKIRVNQQKLEEGPLKGEFEKWKQDFEENVKKA